MHDSKSCAARLVGSNPTSGTNGKLKIEGGNMKVLYSNKFLRRAQEWWRKKNGERKFRNHKEILEEISREFVIVRKKCLDSNYMILTLSKEAADYLEDFVQNSLEQLKIQEFLRSLPTAK